MKKPKSKEVTDDFWYDCLNTQEEKAINGISRYKKYSNYYVRNNNNNKKLKNNHNIILNISHDNKNNKKKGKNSSNKVNMNKTIENQYLSKIYQNHQILKENLETNKEEKEILELKRKKAMRRCHGLYAYGVEVKKTKILDEENNKKEKAKDEMSNCTFRPKLYKYSKSKQAKFIPDTKYNKTHIPKTNKSNNIVSSNGDYKITSSNLNTIENGVTKKNYKNFNKYTINNDEDDWNDFDQCTFKPRIIKKNIKRVFGKSKSMANEKDNAEFILRYNKAREEYMIKKLKKISTKDDSYETTLITLANRLNNKPYRNEPYLQKNIKNRNFSMADYKDSSAEYRRINIEKNIINNLRNDLLDIDLNEEE
jgi:hypothetical protein